MKNHEIWLVVEGFLMHSSSQTHTHTHMQITWLGSYIVDLWLHHVHTTFIHNSVHVCGRTYVRVRVCVHAMHIMVGVSTHAYSNHAPSVVIRHVVSLPPIFQFSGLPRGLIAVCGSGWNERLYLHLFCLLTYSISTC